MFKVTSQVAFFAQRKIKLMPIKGYAYSLLTLIWDPCANQIKSNQIKSNQIKSNKIKSNQDSFKVPIATYFSNRRLLASNP